MCSSRKWKLWGADIKTAFLSGDRSSRELYFKPPPQIKLWMGLSDDDLFRLQKAAYGLADAPRAWFLRLSREMREVGMTQSSLDPCLFYLRDKGQLCGICGVHVDDILGGGDSRMMTSRRDFLSETIEPSPSGTLVWKLGRTLKRLKLR